MLEGREAAQIDPDLRYHDLGRPPTEARDRIHPFHHMFDRPHPLRNFAAQLVNQLVQTIQGAPTAGQAGNGGASQILCISGKANTRFG